jgi:hypothetical protein
VTSTSRLRGRRVAALASLLIATAMLAGCSPSREPIPVTPPAEQASAPVVRRDVDPPPPVVASAPPPAGSVLGAATRPSSPPSVTLTIPEGAIYVCLAEKNGVASQTVIEFSSPRVHSLCKRHPEMGPCQYERTLCRNSGGRVFAANGQEITLATEAEYDKKVMRVRFRAN